MREYISVLGIEGRSRKHSGGIATSTLPPAARENNSWCKKLGRHTCASPRPHSLPLEQIERRAKTHGLALHFDLHRERLPAFDREASGILAGRRAVAERVLDERLEFVRLQVRLNQRQQLRQRHFTRRRWHRDGL